MVCGGGGYHGKRKKKKKPLWVEEPRTDLGLMSHCMGAFPQPLIMSDQVGETMASKPTTVHFMLVVAAAAWVPQMHTFNLH